MHSISKVIGQHLAHSKFIHTCMYVCMPVQQHVYAYIIATDSHDHVHIIEVRQRHIMYYVYIITYGSIATYILCIRTVLLQYVRMFNVGDFSQDFMSI